MSRQLEAKREERQSRLDRLTVAAVEFALEEAVAHSGAELQGFSVSLRGGDCLLTLRGVLAGRRQICFVGAEDFGGALRKAVREAKSDNLSWRDDKYA